METFGGESALFPYVDLGSRSTLTARAVPTPVCFRGRMLVRVPGPPRADPNTPRGRWVRKRPETPQCSRLILLSCTQKLKQICWDNISAP